MLKPDKSKKKKDNSNNLNKHIESPKIPHHLTHLEMKTPLSSITKWSLSGPQFPRPTAFQQRYCYPQGQSEYARTKGAALWTMYTIDGKEDKEYRILHVYFSTKRANNAGPSVSSLSGKSNKLFTKKEKAKRKLTTTNEGQVTKQQKRSSSRNGIRPKLQGHLGFSSSPRIKSDPFFRPSFAGISQNIASMSSETIQGNLSRDGTINGDLSAHDMYPISSFLLNDYDRLDEPSTAFNSDANDSFCENEYPDVSHEHDNMIGVGLADPPILRTETTEWASLIDSVDAKSDFAFSFRRNKTFSDVLVDKLNVLHQKIIHEWIGSRPRSERGRLVNVVATWAQSVSLSPLQLLSPEEGGKQDGSTYVDENVNFEMKNEDMAVAI